MFKRISNGRKLAKQSWKVLNLDKELLVFPLLSGIACLLILCSFGAPIVLNIDHIEQWRQSNEAQLRILVWVGLFLFYFANYFVIVFFNTALLACVFIRFRGGNPTVGDGLRAATARLPQILMWSLLSATVGVTLKAIESRSNRVVKIVAGLVGAAWSIATYFVVPVLVVEKMNVIDAIKRSIAILRKSWGETVVAGFSVGAISFLLALLAFVPIVLGAAALFSGQMVLGGALLACGFLALLVVSLISSALNSIVVGALYLFARDGIVPQQFDRRTLQTAFHSEPRGSASGV